MTDGMTVREFHAAEGAEDWRVVGDGACAFYPTSSFAASAGLVTAIGELPDLDDHAPTSTCAPMA
jgi:4a-hydroxytetrahydrobiopterin dehydratase